jgi:pimeloyl-ACP methyl ester carboxylesterase
MPARCARHTARLVLRLVARCALRARNALVVGSSNDAELMAMAVVRLARIVWQAYLRKHQPPTLVVWGKNDPFFTVAGAHAYKRDVPTAQVHLFEAGHFALEEHAPAIARLMRTFLQKHVKHPSR